MNIARTRRVIAATAVATGLLLSGATLAIADEVVSAPEATSEVESVEAIASAEDGATAEATEVAEESAPAEDDATVETTADEESAEETLSPVTRNAPPKAEPEKVTNLRAWVLTNSSEACVLRVTWEYPKDKADGFKAVFVNTNTLHVWGPFEDPEPNDTSTFGIVDSSAPCEGNEEYDVTVTPVFSDASIQTQGVTVHAVAGSNEVKVSNLNVKINTVNDTCVATATWEWTYDNPVPVGWDYTYTGNLTIGGEGEINDPNARTAEFVIFNRPCEPGDGINLKFAPLITPEDTAIYKVVRVEAAEFLSDPTKPTNPPKPPVKKSQESVKATSTSKQPGLAATGSHSITLFLAALLAVGIGGTSIAVGKRSRL